MAKQNLEKSKELADVNDSRSIYRCYIGSAISKFRISTSISYSATKPPL